MDLVICPEDVCQTCSNFDWFQKRQNHLQALEFSSKFQSKLDGRFDAVVEMTNSVGPKLCSVRSQVGQIGYPPRGYQRLAVTWILGR